MEILKCKSCGCIFNNQMYKYCPVCDEDLELVDITEDTIYEVVKHDIENKLNYYFNHLGIEATLEMLERVKGSLSEPIYKLYYDRLKEKGLVK